MKNLDSDGIPAVTTKFELGDEITEVQRLFLARYGFLHFKGVVSADEVAVVRSELDRIEADHIIQDRRKVNGIPLFWGKGVGGRKRLQRSAFTSLFSDKIRELVHDARFEPIRRLIGEDARVGDREKDGVVVNRYINVAGSVYRRLGWHTDGLRDLFYGRMPQQMLNIGLHLDEVGTRDGGLSLVPGTHEQGFLSMLAAKPSFVGHSDDPREIVVHTNPGDLTIHDGRLWHRVRRSLKSGADSQRRTMYVPYLTGPYEPKDDASPTPGYHRLGQALRAARRVGGALL